MSKITKSGVYNRINIPQHIIDITGWNENTELVFLPYIKDPHEPVTQDTPILIKTIKTKKKNPNGAKRTGNRWADRTSTQ